MNNELEALRAVRELAQGLRKQVVARPPRVAENVTVSVYEQCQRDVGESEFFTALDNAVALVVAMRCTLIERNFKPAKLMDYVPNTEQAEAGSAALGSFRFMQEVARRDYGFYQVHHALHTAFSNLALAAKEPEHYNDLSRRAEALCEFADGAYVFYENNLLKAS